MTDEDEGGKDNKDIGLLGVSPLYFPLIPHIKMGCQYSVSSADNIKALVDKQAPLPDDVFDRNETRTFWRLLIRARQKVPAKMTRNPPSRCLRYAVSK